MAGLHLPSALDLARSQFAFVVIWHFLYPAFTIGLASFLAVLEAVPGCVLISVIAPRFVSDNPAELLALAITLLPGVFNQH